MFPYYLIRIFAPLKYIPWHQCFLLFLLSGCKCQNHDSPPPEMVYTNCWNSQLSPGMNECPIDNFIWWQSLKDPLLDSLIERAKTQNVDLFIAAMRILQAREEIKGGAAGAFPHLDFSTGYDYLQFNQKILDRILGLHHHDRKTKHINLFEAGFDAEWEIDLFGVSANKIKALQNQALASEEEFRQIELTLAAEVARNYIDLRGWQTKLQQIEKQLEVQNDLISLTSGLAQAGFISSIDEVETEKQVYLLQAKKPEVELLIKKSINRISVLLGYPPEVLYAELSQVEPLPQLPYQKPIGVPSELLRQRPDIRKAEKSLASSLALVDSAIAELFPRISLKGFIGDLAAQGSNSLVLFGGPQLLFPLFNSKMLTQSVQINKYKAKEACFAYQKTVLEALEEVENAISTFNSDWEKHEYLIKALESIQKAYTSTFQLYQKGFKSYRDVLEVKQSLLESESTYVQIQLDLLFRYIALYKALGGGWTEEWCE